MTAVHPRPSGSRMTILVNYHGSDTYRFSSDKLDKIERLDRFGKRHRYTTLTRAIQDMFADRSQNPLVIFARWILVGSIVKWEAHHLALRLKLEGVDLDPNHMDDLPHLMTERGIKIWQ